MSVNIMSFNTLRKNFSFNSQYWCDEKMKDWNNRIALHERVITEHYSHCDFLCLQEAEVDSIEVDFNFLCEKLNYSLLKGTTKDNNDRHVHTKPSTFYRKDRFNLVYSEQRSRILISCFEFIERNNEIFYLLNCHLQAHGSSECYSQRVAQLRSAMQKVKAHAKNVLRLKPEEIENLIVIVAGDMNVEARDALDEAHRFLRETCHLQDTFQSESDEFFTHKWGVTHNEAVFNRIDYIYIPPTKVSVRRIIHPLRELCLNPTDPLPNAEHPSDHLPIAAELQFI